MDSVPLKIPQLVQKLPYDLKIWPSCFAVGSEETIQRLLRRNTKWKFMREGQFRDLSADSCLGNLTFLKQILEAGFLSMTRSD